MVPTLETVIEVCPQLSGQSDLQITSRVHHENRFENLLVVLQLVGIILFPRGSNQQSSRSRTGVIDHGWFTDCLTRVWDLINPISNPRSTRIKCYPYFLNTLCKSFSLIVDSKSNHVENLRIITLFIHCVKTILQHGVHGNDSALQLSLCWSFYHLLFHSRKSSDILSSYYNDLDLYLQTIISSPSKLSRYNDDLQVGHCPGVTNILLTNDTACVGSRFSLYQAWRSLKLSWRYRAASAILQ